MNKNTKMFTKERMKQYFINNELYPSSEKLRSVPCDLIEGEYSRGSIFKRIHELTEGVDGVTSECNSDLITFFSHLLNTYTSTNQYVSSLHKLKGISKMRVIKESYLDDSLKSVVPIVFNNRYEDYESVIWKNHVEDNRIKILDYHKIDELYVDDVLDFCRKCYIHCSEVKSRLSYEKNKSRFINVRMEVVDKPPIIPVIPPPSLKRSHSYTHNSLKHGKTSFNHFRKYKDSDVFNSIKR